MIKGSCYLSTEMNWVVEIRLSFLTKGNMKPPSSSGNHLGVVPCFFSKFVITQEGSDGKLLDVSTSFRARDVVKAVSLRIPTVSLHMNQLWMISSIGWPGYRIFIRANQVEALGVSLPNYIGILREDNMGQLLLTFLVSVSTHLLFILWVSFKFEYWLPILLAEASNDRHRELTSRENHSSMMLTTTCSVCWTLRAHFIRFRIISKYDLSRQVTKYTDRRCKVTAN